MLQGYLYVLIANEYDKYLIFVYIKINFPKLCNIETKIVIFDNFVE